ncbi:MAG: peptidylprolyl isomerase [Acidobacteriota bacterium]|nr:peptidylprolyl isomerase [Acidobacteriota bacterium]MDQ2839654.1 peptidylprolyl isomerase [Acidobacteriota bacterium]
MTRRQLWTSLAASALPLFAASCGGKKTGKMSPGPAQYKVRFQTTKGDVVILVHRDWSPLGADHFYELTQMHFYDNNAFFRALKGFVVQWGVSGDPQVNKSWSEITIKDDPPKVPNKTGTVVFAKTGELNSRTTQCFINLGDNSAALDPQGFTPFGEVIQGMENVMKIYTDYGEISSDGTGPGPNPAAIADIGNPYLEEHFPKLDYIKTARIIP